MTLRELLQSVDAEAYASVPLFEELLNTKPEYGSGNRIEVKLVMARLLFPMCMSVRWATSWLVLSMWLLEHR